MIGNPLGGASSWTSVSVDYIRAFNLPEVVAEDKVILLPGLGASWNSEAMVYNQQVDPGEWQMTPFVNNYKGLIEALEEEGLVKDEDFWVWNYDWRQPVEDIFPTDDL